MAPKAARKRLLKWLAELNPQLRAIPVSGRPLLHTSCSARSRRRSHNGTLVSRIGAGQAAYSTLLFPLVALAISTLYEGYVWHPSAVAGLLLILTGNLVMFARPQRPLFRRRGAA